MVRNAAICKRAILRTANFSGALPLFRPSPVEKIVAGEANLQLGQNLGTSKSNQRRPHLLILPLIWGFLHFFLRPKFAYTVNDPALIQWLLWLGTDGIVTDRPDRWADVIA